MRAPLLAVTQSGPRPEETRAAGVTVEEAPPHKVAHDTDSPTPPTEEAEHDPRCDHGMIPRSDGTVSRCTDCRAKVATQASKSDRRRGPGRRDPLPMLPPWCGDCDPRGRTLELDDGSVSRCSRCNPRSAALAAKQAHPLPTPDLPAYQHERSITDSTRALADRIIDHAARAHDLLSANETREAMDAAGVPETIRGPRFAAAARAGLLTPVGYIAGTNPGNKGKPIRLYRSRVWSQRPRELEDSKVPGNGR